MKIPCQNFVYLLFVSIMIGVQAKKKPKGPQCSTCKEIVDNFAKGLERTKKQNYGGGNTNWEESRLGQYANSEIRLVEIMDDLCKDASKECHPLLEEHEELVEEFWFKSGLSKVEAEFHKYFCIDSVKACCPENTYGPSCKPCTGGAERPCRGNGECNGGGTRGGTGKCKCNLGYSGKDCSSCTEGYFEDQNNDTHTVCKVCHIACKTSCTADGPNACDACKEGYNHESTGCQDINECVEDEPCDDNEYCSNTQGSYVCMSCNVACVGCSGPGADKCTECSDGFIQNEKDCIDVDECDKAGDEAPCAQEGEKCVNTAGSYKCICQAGFTKDGDGCIPKPAEVEKEETEESGSEEKDQSEEHPNTDEITEEEKSRHTSQEEENQKTEL